MDSINKKFTLYASVEEEIIHFECHTNEASISLESLERVKLPVPVQYADISPQASSLYAISSNAGNGVDGAAGDTHLLSAFKIDRDSGTLEPLGEPILLPERPIHVSLTGLGRYVLVAFNKSGTVQAYKIAENGAVQEKVEQTEIPDAGIFTHQVLPDPSGDFVVAVSRGNDVRQNKPEELGMLTIFKFNKGNISRTDSILMNAGVGPRHLGFHSSKPWVYVSVERGNKLFMYSIKEGTLSRQPVFTKDTLLNPDIIKPKQRAGAIHVHPNGRYVYVTNRAELVVKEGDKEIFGGGENNIAVFEIDEYTGEPNLIQHIDSKGIEPRTFSIDPDGRFLIVANQKTMLIREGDELSTLAANMAVFEISDNGKLKFIKKYDFKADGRRIFWVGTMRL